MKKLELEKEFPVLQEAEEKIQRYKSMPFTNTDIEFVERMVAEYRVLAFINIKQAKQISLLKILLNRKGKNESLYS